MPKNVSKVLLSAENELVEKITDGVFFDDLGNKTIWCSTRGRSSQRAQTWIEYCMMVYVGIGAGFVVALFTALASDK